ncbi:Growth-regulating factor 5 [Gossypium australe]|uniref:Growth-regulating factor 5 n=1 Tax=Gossypium australe TaxID=47621 RepID=A0A5B6V4E4_9ROSI|nr:Growth-regulating factor 5 [Gossypium australe]
MRIRKRQVPLPFSSISPVPLSSDPNFNRPPVAVVQLPIRQQQPPNPCCFDPHYPSQSDHPIGQPLPTQPRDGTTHGEQLTKNKQDYLVLKPGGEEEEEKNNDTRWLHFVVVVVVLIALKLKAVERWGEGEKAFPLKKRRGSVETTGDDDDTIMAKDTNNKRPMKSSTSKMKTKLNKKLVQQQQQSNGEEQESKDIACTSVDYNNNNSSGAKKRGRGGALMEGSRCSRVNGRGWRCCQQTLVGYSLCEHHLGKGRLRSMTSVRSRSLAAKEEGQPNNGDNQGLMLSNLSSSSQQLAKRELHGESGGNYAEGEDQKPLMMTKKKAKLGMVKARSISSLLGQNDNAIAVADDNN